MGGDALIKQVVEDTAAAHEGLLEPIRFAQTKINQRRIQSKYVNWIWTFCHDCQGPIKKKKKEKSGSKIRQGHKNVQRKKIFPDSEFLDEVISLENGDCVALVRLSRSKKTRRLGEIYRRSAQWLGYKVSCSPTDVWIF